MAAALCPFVVAPEHAVWVGLSDGRLLWVNVDTGVLLDQAFVHTQAVRCVCGDSPGLPRGVSHPDEPRSPHALATRESRVAIVARDPILATSLCCHRARC